MYTTISIMQMVEKQNNKKEANSVHTLYVRSQKQRQKNKDIVKEMLKKENSTLEESLRGKLKEEIE